jgi:hypothetical protein
MTEQPIDIGLLEVDGPEDLTEGERVKLEEQVIRGAEAQRIIHSEMFQASFDAPILTLWKKWMKTKPEETDKREQIYHRCCALNQVRDGLTKLARKGTVAEGRLRDGEEEPH